MRPFVYLVATAFAAVAAPVDDFIATARAEHGALGEKAARFLVEHMPEKDRTSLAAEFLIENLRLALRAREEFPWAKEVPEEIFLNDVLPYAVFDEPRDPWRSFFLGKAAPVVKDAKTATEAAQALNREIFNIVNVHYHTGRKRPNQSAKESMEIGKATCTGLSIILVNACRAVGIPARAVGTPLWANERGNHTWVEIWDGDWHFTGADEYDKEGLDRGWFTGDAAQAKADEPRHAIYATSWKQDGLSFPMVWAPRNEQVAAVNVTARYTGKAGAVPSAAETGVRLFDRKNGERLVAEVVVTDESGRVLGQATTKASTADLNDMPRFSLPAGTRGWLRFTTGGETREFAFTASGESVATLDAFWSELPPASAAVKAVEDWLASGANPDKADGLPSGFTGAEAERITGLLASHLQRVLAEERKKEIEEKAIGHDGKTLKWEARVFGDSPAGGRSLWISMHGGGGAPPRVNDQQWRNQIGLYEPSEGIYVAPRAPTDTWNLWHEGHIDPMFQRLIEDHVILEGVNPDKVYLMGYSAGGDGVWQLAPRMADRFAAAAMMAGHPNEASLLGLRNLPFAIFMGEKDAAYDRNRIAGERTAELGRLRSEDPDGYVHLSRIYEGLGHWMERKDAEALPWMATFTRNPWPKKIVWLQDDITHDRFYWIRIPDRTAVKAGATIVATAEGQTLSIKGDVPSGTELRLSDRLVDLDQEITVVVNGKEVHNGKIQRTTTSILSTLGERFDPPAAATATLVLP